MVVIVSLMVMIGQQVTFRLLCLPEGESSLSVVRPMVLSVLTVGGGCIITRLDGCTMSFASVCVDIS